MKRSSAHTAVAYVSNAHNRRLLQARSQKHAGHDRNHVAEMRDGTNEALFHIAKVDIEIATAGRSPGFGHVLRENFARSNSFHEYCAEIANQRRDEVVRLERISGAHGSSFLAERAKNASHHFRLPIEVDEPFLNQACQLQITIKL